MAQHDMVVDNAPGLAVRSDINAALAALVSSSSGTVEPLTKVAGQLWFNTSSGLLSLRNAANTAWVGVASQLGGTVTLTSPLSFTGTSTGVGAGLIAVRDSVVTVGAEGNVVFAINKQNSATHGLMLGNDGNGAALIGNNNAALRFGKWVSGVFTEYLNMTSAGIFTFAGTQQVIIGGAGGGIEIAGATPSIKMKDTTASAYDFWMHVDAQNWYVLVDRDGNGAYETPHPLTLEADTNKGFLFGSEIMTTATAIVSPTTQVIAGNGLTGGGALSANVTLNVGTPGNITNSSTNTVGADTHAHALGFTAAEVYAGTGASDTALPLGHTIFVALGAARYDNNSAQTISLSGTTGYVVGTTAPLAGTWRSRGGFTASGDRFGVFERTA
ncbi:phage tail protein [Sinorhizobium meliloti]|uniref:phage tail protein n=1 Tax=Rhizobium meliloti TaxID=382 RepID=UPI000FDCBADA|nr:phage tail protein [Sinorhizobium meliloti]MDE3825056.1 phage tail protein [Sinorhizobium meliloti]RVM38167.1 phage tail protein [Sinorhizobium meliloti]RVN59660.1 phage tail protein [Sinorhizobium meliloti]